MERISFPPFLLFFLPSSPHLPSPLPSLSSTLFLGVLEKPWKLHRQEGMQCGCSIALDPTKWFCDFIRSWWHPFLLKCLAVKTRLQPIRRQRLTRSESSWVAQMIPDSKNLNYVAWLSTLNYFSSFLVWFWPTGRCQVISIFKPCKILVQGPLNSSYPTNLSIKTCAKWHFQSRYFQ